MRRWSTIVSARPIASIPDDGVEAFGIFGPESIDGPLGGGGLEQATDGEEVGEDVVPQGAEFLHRGADSHSRWGRPMLLRFVSKNDTKA